MKGKADEFLQCEFFARRLNESLPPASLSIDMGSGPAPRNPFKAKKCIGLDIIDSANAVKCNLFLENMPFEDEAATYVTAYEFLEHIPRVLMINNEVHFRFVELMSDVYRVLHKGGYFFSQTPVYPSLASFQDPTHVNYITSSTFSKYFCIRSGGRLPGASRYGFSKGFEFVAQKVFETHIICLLRKPL